MLAAWNSTPDLARPLSIAFAGAFYHVTSRGDRLAALVPRPRVNLTPIHGVFAPNSRNRASVTPAKRGKGATPKAAEQGQETTLPA